MEEDISENDWKPRLFLLFLSDNLQLFLKFLNCRINTKYACTLFVELNKKSMKQGATRAITYHLKLLIIILDE
jgi:hypothetical protein